MSNYQSAYNDFMSGKEPQTFGLSPNDTNEYLKNYFAVKLGFEYGKMVGDGIAEISSRLFQLFFYRMAYIFPGLLFLLIIFDYNSWTGFNDIKDFVKYNLADNLITLLLQIIFIITPICILFYYLYLYLRGLELGNFILKNNDKKQKMLFYGIGIYTIGISCIGVYMLFSLFASYLFSVFPSNFQWIKYVFFIYVTWKLMNYIVDFHWNDYKNLQWAKDSYFFKKGMKKAFQNNVKVATLEQIRAIDINDLDRPARKKKITKLKYIVFAMLILYSFSFNKFMENKKELHQLTIEGKNPDRPLVTSEEIFIYPENNHKKTYIAFLKMYIHRDSLFNEIEGTLKGGYYYIDFEKNPHWIGISDIKLGSISREIYEKRKPKKVKSNN